MLSLTITLPASGRNLSAPRGVRTAVLLQGRWRSDDDVQPLITLQLYGRSSIATIHSATSNSAAGTWQAPVELDCPSRNAVQASITAWVAGGSGHLHRQTATAAPLFLRVRDPQHDPAYHLQGTVVDARRAPVPGVEVTVFDRDRGSRDDRLGSARSADDGSFELRFTESQFSETPEERGPDLVFTARSASGQSLQAGVLDARGGWLPNADPAPPPFLLRVSPATGFVLGTAVRAKWQALGGSAGALGLPLGDEIVLPGGPASPGFQAVFAGGSVVRLLAFETSAVLGAMHSSWHAQGGGVGWLGWPVADAVTDPTAAAVGALAQVFEHGVLRWQPGPASATASGHDFARLHGQLRAQLLARFFAIGRNGRRNWFSCFNRIHALPPAPGTPGAAAADAQIRWGVERHEGENPWLFGTALVAALAVEENAGNPGSRQALKDWLATARSLFQWRHPGPQGEGRLPLRWDAHGLLDTGARPARCSACWGPGWRKTLHSATARRTCMRCVTGPGSCRWTSWWALSALTG